ncbi:hypothetical protein Tco_0028046, partial [Tanacetum coccineum]
MVVTYDDERSEVPWKDMSFKDWLKVRYGKLDQMAARKIFNDCMMEDFQDESNNLKDENMVASEGFMAYTQQGFYAVTNFQDEEAGSINDGDP